MGIDVNKQQIFDKLKAAIDRIGRPKINIKLPEISTAEVEEIKDRLWQVMELWYDIKNKGFFKIRPRSVLKIDLKQDNLDFNDNSALLLKKSGVYWQGFIPGSSEKIEIYLRKDKGDLAADFISGSMESKIILSKLRILLSWTAEKLTDVINKQLEPVSQKKLR